MSDTRKFFHNVDFSDFWSDDDYAEEYYTDEYPTDSLIADIEEELGYKLPESYIWLMREHNGGMPVKNCFPTNIPNSWAEDHIQIEGILAVSRTKESAICGEFGSRYMTEEWEFPEIGILICDTTSGGPTAVFLDYSECGPAGEPKVVFVDVEGHAHKIILADTFEEFICGLVDESGFENE